MLPPWLVLLEVPLHIVLLYRRVSDVKAICLWTVPKVKWMSVWKYVTMLIVYATIGMRRRKSCLLFCHPAHVCLNSLDHLNGRARDAAGEQVPSAAEDE